MSKKTTKFTLKICKRIQIKIAIKKVEGYLFILLNISPTMAETAAKQRDFEEREREKKKCSGVSCMGVQSIGTV